MYDLLYRNKFTFFHADINQSEVEKNMNKLKAVALLSSLL